MGHRPPTSRADRAAAGAKAVDEGVAVIIVNYRTPELTKACLSGLLSEHSEFRDLRVLVVDGGSGDNSADELTRLVARPEFRDWVKFLALPINGGFGWANNQAVHRLMASSDRPQYIHLLNPDAQIDPVRSSASRTI